MKIPALTPARRRAIYLIATAVMPILIAYGLLDAERAPLWLALVSSILVPGMAALHTDPATTTGMPADEVEDGEAKGEFR